MPFTNVGSEFCFILSLLNLPNSRPSFGRFADWLTSKGNLTEITGNFNEDEDYSVKSEQVSSHKGISHKTTMQAASQITKQIWKFYCTERQLGERTNPHLLVKSFSSLSE